jgi:hypothetical protein
VSVGRCQLFCNYCRSLNRNDAIYCSACGRTIRSASPESRAQTDNVAETLDASEPVRTIEPFNRSEILLTPDSESKQSATHTSSDISPIARVLSPAGLEVPADPSPSEHRDTTPAVRSTASSGAADLAFQQNVPAYASMGRRFTAYLVDLIVSYFVFLVACVLAFALKLPIKTDGAEPQLLWVGALFLYMIAALAAYHTTIGKYGRLSLGRRGNRLWFLQGGLDQRYAALQHEMSSASDAVDAARQDVTNELNNAPTVNTWTDFNAWQGVMKSLRRDLDVYESRLDHVQELIQRGISEDLVASKAERRELAILQQVYRLRKQQAEKLSQEADLVINCAPTQTAYNGLQDDLRLIDSNVKGLESEVTQLLAQIASK